MINLHAVISKTHVTMETFRDILIVTLPALLVMLTAWLVIRYMLRDETNRRRQDLLLQTVKTGL